MPAADLEQQRNLFLDQLHRHTFDAGGHVAVSAYWQAVAREAEATEDLGRLDGWLKELARDKDRLAELRAQQQQAASSQMGAAEAVQLITRLLALLDDVGVQLRRKLAALRDQMSAHFLIMGMRRKKPETEKEEQAQQAVVLAPKPEKAPPTKTKSG